MTTRPLRFLCFTGGVLLLASCTTTPSTDSAEEPSSASERASKSDSRGEDRREPLTATETAVAERRAASTGGREGGTSNPTETAKLVDQLNEAARELATLRTTNAKLRAERERARPAPAAESSSRADPADERLAASLKSFSQFKQEMTNLITEVERLKRANAELGADLKAATEQARQAKVAFGRYEEDVRIEKRLRQESEANAAQLREQLRTIARAMASAGLSAEKLTAQADGGSRSGARSASTTPSKYIVREGDTLMKIADRVYGDADKWRLIQEANRMRAGAESRLEVGMELQIPRN